MKRLFAYILFCLCVSVTSSAQVRMRDLFLSMPDSLLPMMSSNDRLFCADFIENNMEAKVRNSLDQFVELKQMTQDYLMLETSRVSRLEMKCIPQTDSTALVFVVRTYMGPAADSHVACYDQNWRVAPLSICRPPVASFFKSATDTDAATLLQGAIRSLQDLTFLEAKLSSDAPVVTWTIGLDELSRDEKKAAQQYVQPITQSLLQ